MYLRRHKVIKKQEVRQIVSNFILHKYIRLTLSRCKYIKPIVEKIITHFKKKDSLEHKFLKYNNYLTHSECIVELRKIALLNVDRPGGYCRIIKLGHRHGDSAEIGVLELVNKDKLS